MLNFVERQHAQIGNVRQKVEGNDQRGAAQQRERDVAPWFLHLCGRESDVIPGIGGKERSDLGNAERDEQAEGAAGRRDRGEEGQIRQDRRHLTRGPEIAEVGAQRRGVASQENANHDQRSQRQGLSRGEEVEFMTMLWFDSIENVRVCRRKLRNTRHF